MSPVFVVNVEVFLRRGDTFLLIQRGAGLANAPGLLAGPGGKAEHDSVPADVLEETGRREVLEEIGVDLTGTKLAYVESVLFLTADGQPAINVVFCAEMPPGQQPRIASPREVADVLWSTYDQLKVHPNCPPWTLRSLGKLV
jgi:8-oxo-dGTP pyrophosphatase MutT (NUDIX family)